MVEAGEVGIGVVGTGVGVVESWVVRTGVVVGVVGVLVVVAGVVGVLEESSHLLDIRLKRLCASLRSLCERMA